MKGSSLLLIGLSALPLSALAQQQQSHPPQSTLPTPNQPYPGMMMGGYSTPMMGMMRGGQMMTMPMMGPMMMGPNCCAYPGSTAQGTLNLSAADVKAQLERWVTWNGNPRLKVGKVAEKDAGTVTAEIVTKDDSVVQSFNVDRHTGLYSPAQ